MDSEFLTEAERLARVESIRATLPEVAKNVPIGGALAGGPSPDRPPVPVWEYLDYQAAHSSHWSVEDLAQVRFPIRLNAGVTTVTSIEETVELHGQIGVFEVSVSDVVRLYALMHEHGAMRWVADAATHEEVLPPAEYTAAAYGAWRETLRPLGG